MMINRTLDGRPVRVVPGTTLCEAAALQGFAIPVARMDRCALTAQRSIGLLIPLT
jgi:hypothetical protein